MSSAIWRGNDVTITLVWLPGNRRSDQLMSDTTDKSCVETIARIGLSPLESHLFISRAYQNVIDLLVQGKGNKQVDA